MTYTVVAVYGPSACVPFQRYADSVEADSPKQAEKIVLDSSKNELIIAGVFEGDHQAVDEDPALNPEEEEE